MSKQYWLLSLLVIAIVSCRRKPVEQNGGGNGGGGQQTQQVQVITTGYVDKRWEGVAHPYYWINDTRFELDRGNSTYSIPNGIEKHGEDLYIAGGFLGTHPVMGEMFLPCYWKNGVKINLPVDDIDFIQLCGARDVRWLNGTLFIKGYADWEPVLWKVKDNVATVVPFDKSNDGSYSTQSGSDFVLYNNMLHFSGTISRKQPNGSFLFEAGYWTIGQSEKPVFHVVENNMGFARSIGIAASSKGVFITGEVASNTGRADERSVIWSSNGRLTVLDQLNRNKQRAYGIVSDEAGNLYITLHDLLRSKPIVWKILPNGNHVEIIPAIPAASTGLSRGLATLGNIFAYGYIYESEDKNFAAYAIGDKTVPLVSHSETPITTSRIRIFPM